MIKKSLFGLVICLLFMVTNAWAQGLPDTGQTKCYDNEEEISCPQPGEAFYGQDAEYVKARSYTDLGNGIVRDNVTGLEWIQDGNLIATRDPSFPQYGGWWSGKPPLIMLSCSMQITICGYDDWRLPTIQELSSLVDSSRINPAIDPLFSTVASTVIGRLIRTCTIIRLRVDGGHRHRRQRLQRGGQSPCLTSAQCVAIPFLRIILLTMATAQ